MRRHAVISVVARWELGEQLRIPSYRAALVTMVLVAVASSWVWIAPGLLGTAPDPPVLYRVGAVGDSVAIAHRANRLDASVILVVVQLTDQNEAARAVQQNRVHAAVDDSLLLVRNPDSAVVDLLIRASALIRLEKMATDGEIPEETVDLVATGGLAVIALPATGLDPASVAALVERIPLGTLSGFVDAPSSRLLVATFAVLVALVMVAHLLGIAPALGRERTTQTADRHLMVASPIELMVGKVTGLVGGGLLLFGISAAVGAVTLAIRVPELFAGIGFSAITQAFVGFLLTGALFGTANALVGARSRQPDQAILAKQAIVVTGGLGMGAGLAAAAAGESAFLLLGALLPFSGPFLVIAGAIGGTLKLWQFATAVVSAGATTVWLLRVASSGYERQVQEPKVH